MILLEGLGVEGDFHRNGEKQVSLLSAEVNRWMETQTVKGLCFRRFQSNILVEEAANGLALEEMRSGMFLSAGNAVLRVSTHHKKCFSECDFLADGKPCRLSACVCFANVVCSGVVRIGDLLSIL